MNFRLGFMLYLALAGRATSGNVIICDQRLASVRFPPCIEKGRHSQDPFSSSTPSISDSL
jgi:hypothetical protein